MDKTTLAPVPPMGWNSYDFYNTEVNEEQVRANALYMAENLKAFGFITGALSCLVPAHGVRLYRY